jgi:hypothetical protein
MLPFLSLLQYHRDFYKVHYRYIFLYRQMGQLRHVALISLGVRHSSVTLYSAHFTDINIFQKQSTSEMILCVGFTC